MNFLARRSLKFFLICEKVISMGLYLSKENGSIVNDLTYLGSYGMLKIHLNPASLIAFLDCSHVWADKLSMNRQILSTGLAALRELRYSLNLSALTDLLKII